jgi:hypothetical protein
MAIPKQHFDVLGIWYYSVFNIIISPPEFSFARKWLLHFVKVFGFATGPFLGFMEKIVIPA